MSEQTRTLADELGDRAGAVLDGTTRAAVDTFVSRATQAHPELGPRTQGLAAQLWPALQDAPLDGWPDVLERLVAPDLLLAVALGEGDNAAVAIFERDLAPQIQRALERLRTSEAEVADMMQQLRMHLLVAPEPGTKPRIARYGARGSLAGWLRTSALRYAYERKAKRTVTGEPEPLQRMGLLPSVEPPSRGALRRRRLRTAVGDAFAELPSRDRRLLRARYVSGQTATSLADEHGVHESTMSRWLARARTELEWRIRARAKVIVDPLDDSAMPLVETLISDIEVSLRGLFDTRADS